MFINAHPESIIFGTSATPVRSDGVNTIDELFESNCASDLPLSESIARKIVPLPKYVGALYTLDDELERLRTKVANATNTMEEKQEFYKKIESMRGQIEKSYGMPIILNKNVKNKEGRYLIFCKNKKHLAEIKDTVIEWFRTAGCKDINAYVVHSSYEGKDKEYKAFCDDTSYSLKLLFCVDMLNEGLHLENISGVLLLRPTRSSIVWHQQIGRAIEANNTHSPVIIDAVNNFSAVGQGMELLQEIKDAVAREKESDPDYDDSGFDDIDTFFVLENVIEIQEMFAEIEGRLIGREWTEEENNILREWYPIEGTKVADRLEGRTKSAVAAQAYKLDLKAPNDLWTEDEDNILKEWYLIEGSKVIDRLNGRTLKAIQCRANNILGLYIYKPWSEEEIKILKEYYPIEGMKVADRLNGRTISMVQEQIRKLKLKYYNSWSKEEIEILNKYYPIEGMKVADRLNGRTKNAIQRQIGILKLKCNRGNKYKYVYKHRNKYIVRIYIDGTNMRFGSFDNEEEAAKVALEKAREFGKAI